MLVKDFIKGPLFTEIEQMTIGAGGVPTHPYLGFQLISSSVEFLGACLDQYEWGERGMSEKRFNLALDHLFDDKYKKGILSSKFDLYSNLRCSLSHTIRPGNHVGLSEIKHGAKHLSESSERLILVYENFLEDFKKACEKTIEMIDARIINNEKVYGHVIKIPSD